MVNRSEVTPWRQRRISLLVAVPCALLTIALAVVIERGLEPAPAIAAPTIIRPPRATTTTTAPAPRPEVPVSTLLATPQGEIATFDAPDGTEIGTVGIWYGYRLTMPIVEEQGAWLRIMLPERPNGSTAWVRADSVTLSTSPWRMVVTLSETRLRVYKDGFEVWNVPVGIGRDHTRTPTGTFFVAVIEKPGPPGFGPLVLNTNAHSEDVDSWKGIGDAIAAFHGPFGAEELIRSGGGKASNGCVRMLPEDQLKMEGITHGTPVDIVD